MMIALQTGRGADRRRSGGPTRVTRCPTVRVRPDEGRCHGNGDELPSTFALFRALVAGDDKSRQLELDEDAEQALRWLEECAGTLLVAWLHLVPGMPNRDLNKFGGDV